MLVWWMVPIVYPTLVLILVNPVERRRRETINEDVHRLSRGLEEIHDGYSLKRIATRRINVESDVRIAVLIQCGLNVLGRNASAEEVRTDGVVNAQNECVGVLGRVEKPT